MTVFGDEDFWTSRIDENKQSPQQQEQQKEISETKKDLC